jgi:hypothetical protein
MVEARDDEESLVARRSVVHSPRVIDVGRILFRGDEERGRMHLPDGAPGGETLEDTRPGKAGHPGDGWIVASGGKDGRPAHRRSGEGDRVCTLASELGDRSKHMAVEIAGAREVKGEDAHAGGGEPLSERQPGAEIAVKLVREDDAGGALAEDDAVEVGAGAPEVDDLRRCVLVCARVERLPRG